ncbi:MAG TPA: DUF6191 domain-containing protein [Actinomycetes bacterium]
MGLAFALTLPGLVVLLVIVAFVDQALLRLRGCGIVAWRRDAPVSSTGFDLLHAALSPGKQHELDQRSAEELVRDDEDDGAPPHSRIDFAAGVARLHLTERVRG